MVVFLLFLFLLCFRFLFLVLRFVWVLFSLLRIELRFFVGKMKKVKFIKMCLFFVLIWWSFCLIFLGRGSCLRFLFVFLICILRWGSISRELWVWCWIWSMFMWWGWGGLCIWLWMCWICMGGWCSILRCIWCLRGLGWRSRRGICVWRLWGMWWRRGRRWRGIRGRSLWCCLGGWRILCFRKG